VAGCVPVFVGTGVITGGYVAIRDKGIGDSISDSKIDMAIKKKLYRISKKLYSEVSVATDMGAVLLTGIVSDPEWVSIAEREAWAENGVKTVDNNLVHGDEISVSQILKDGTITSSCRSVLICTSSVRSVNYKLKTMNGVVYVRGTARSGEELNTALSQIRRVKGVQKVVSYVTMK
jgi:osmotically-inducible protein OsmY